MAKKRLLEYRSAPAGLLTNGEGEGRVGLLERLKRFTEADADLMPPSLIRKYIAYARTYVHPTLSPGAKQVSYALSAAMGLKLPWDFLHVQLNAVLWLYN